MGRKVQKEHGSKHMHLREHAMYVTSFFIVHDVLTFEGPGQDTVLFAGQRKAGRPYLRTPHRMRARLFVLSR